MKEVTKVHYHSVSKVLDVHFDDQTIAQFSAEFLRVHSPSAEVQGHGNEPMKLVLGKQQVGINKIEPVGHYAIQITFDDGHDSGLYTWQTFRDLGDNFEKNWAEYESRLANEGGSRDAKVLYKKVE